MQLLMKFYSNSLKYIFHGLKNIKKVHELHKSDYLWSVLSINIGETSPYFSMPGLSTFW